MAMHVANYFEAQRFSATAAAAMGMGVVIKMSAKTDGSRLATVLGNGDSALLLSGNYGVAYKVSADPFQVNSSTAASFLGDRTVSIASGDAIVELRKGTIISYTADLLDASLDVNRSGATPVAGQALGVVDGKFCTTGAASAITSPVIARCYKVVGTQILIELVY